MTSVENDVKFPGIKSFHLGKAKGEPQNSLKTAESDTVSSERNLPLNRKMIDLGIARRPSDNLQMNEFTGSNITKLPPPKRNFKNERPISDESISTRASEIFSPLSSETPSGSSSLANDSDDDADATHEASIPSDANNTTLVISNKKTYRNSAPVNSTIIAEDSDGNISSLSSPSSKSQNHNALYGNGNKAKIPFIRSINNNSTPNFNPMHKIINGPYNKNINQNTSLYSRSNSTTAILPNKISLTASQRYRLRKEQTELSLRKSIKNKEKFYDSQDPIVELQENDFVDDSLIWNIPMASFSTASFLNSASSKSAKRSSKKPSSSIIHLNEDTALPQPPPIPSSFTPSPKQHEHRNSDTSYTSTASSNTSILDFYEMPTSPIPGVTKLSDFQYIKETTKTLSSIYLHSQNRLSRTKLMERTSSAEVLPFELKEASDKGMEDLLLVSEDKLELVSHTRPSWLPPKDANEKRQHEEQISKTMSMASIDELDKHKGREERIIRDETNRAKLVLLLDREVTRNSSLTSLKKIVWETSFSEENRFSLYDEILQSKLRFITTNYLESFDRLSSLLDSMNFPKGKELEIEQLIEHNLKNKRCHDDVMSSDLLFMLKLKSISSQGLVPGDELLFHHFLIDGSFKSLKDIWEIVNLIQMTCFNDLTKEKYETKILNSRGVVASYLLRSNDFKDEFNTTCLNSVTWWHIMQRLNHKLFMWILDIIVVANSQSFKNYPIKPEVFVNKDWEYFRSKKVVVNYKILLALTLDVLLNYHFGFIDLNELSKLDDKNFTIPIPMDELLDEDEINGMFVRKWLHYYKKF
ncbi:hypothetical protein KAFR_0D04960 [Kazachstania africana CBS 2517]|uniref:Protein SBE22 n=1 Tax=Kazachstania africana (strain ATCC 22294 / BCRC 22015 / CBS 2517 / CECT 1963 / NBRC 1671 / NRRL Y-8276) TaxID=1071382 RepID=H2AUU3_KAZAF|nr:hypothetical protein KAFR_0D04960 [Kazachstania africana CBS 2517]CCF58143.1 hypothetical protein KAFR_0D04960 [Kazachstania africana CBS 2517]